MSDGIDKLAGGLGKAIETAPALYDDALKPTTQETGKLLGRIPRAINAALSGIDKWILNKEYNVEETKKLLSQKLENLPPENIVIPDAYVAVPAIQAISYSMNNDELRNLYANLLAKSMSIDTKSIVHPAFVEIIKQMSPLDAMVLNHIEEFNFIPIVNLGIKTTTSNTSKKNMTKNITDFSFSSDTMLISVSIDNLQRLGLIEIPENKKLLNNTRYDSIYDGEHFKLARANLHKIADKDNGEKVVISKRYIRKTNLGKAFIKICIND